MHKRSYIAPLLVALLFAMGCSRDDAAEIRNITITTASPGDVGVTLHLHARLYPPARSQAEPPPGLVLVHRAGGNHAVWERFAHHARQAGYMLLALDLRGHGESAQPADYPGTHRDFTPSHWMAALEDITAAAEALVEAGADPDNIGVVGEGLGANLALHWYQRTPNVQALVALSPGLNYEGIRTEDVAHELHFRPVMYLAGEDDSYSVRSATTLRDITPGFAELRTFRGFAYGAEIYESSVNAMEITLQWLDSVLKPDEDA